MAPGSNGASQGGQASQERALRNNLALSTCALGRKARRWLRLIGASHRDRCRYVWVVWCG